LNILYGCSYKTYQQDGASQVSWFHERGGEVNHE
jgi:hypothetical protein